MRRSKTHFAKSIARSYAEHHKQVKAYTESLTSYVEGFVQVEVLRKYLRLLSERGKEAPPQLCRAVTRVLMIGQWLKSTNPSTN